MTTEITPTKCGECPLFICDDRGDYCAHPDVEFKTVNGPRVPQPTLDGDTLPERCPLKKGPLTIRLPT